MTVAVAAVALGFLATPTQGRGDDRDQGIRARDARNFTERASRFGRGDLDRLRNFSDDRLGLGRDDRARRALDDDRFRDFRRDDDRFDRARDFRRDDDRFDRDHDDDRLLKRFRNDDRRDRRDERNGNKRRHRHRRGSR